jgi:hypothetical protein
MATKQMSAKSAKSAKYSGDLNDPDGNSSDNSSSNGPSVDECKNPALTNVPQQATHSQQNAPPNAPMYNPQQVNNYQMYLYYAKWYQSMISYYQRVQEYLFQTYQTYMATKQKSAKSATSAKSAKSAKSSGDLNNSDDNSSDNSSSNSTSVDECKQPKEIQKWCRVKEIAKDAYCLARRIYTVNVKKSENNITDFSSEDRKVTCTLMYPSDLEKLIEKRKKIYNLEYLNKIVLKKIKESGKFDNVYGSIPCRTHYIYTRFQGDNNRGVYYTNVFYFNGVNDPIMAKTREECPEHFSKLSRRILCRSICSYIMENVLDMSETITIVMVKVVTTRIIVYNAQRVKRINIVRVASVITEEKFENFDNASDSSMPADILLVDGNENVIVNDFVFYLDNPKLSDKVMFPIEPSFTELLWKISEGNHDDKIMCSLRETFNISGSLFYLGRNAYSMRTVSHEIMPNPLTEIRDFKEFLKMYDPFYMNENWHEEWYKIYCRYKKLNHLDYQFVKKESIYVARVNYINPELDKKMEKIYEDEHKIFQDECAPEGEASDSKQSECPELGKQSPGSSQKDDNAPRVPKVLEHKQEAPQETQHTMVLRYSSLFNA